MGWRTGPATDSVRLSPAPRAFRKGCSRRYRASAGVEATGPVQPMLRRGASRWKRPARPRDGAGNQQASASRGVRPESPPDIRWRVIELDSVRRGRVGDPLEGAIDLLHWSRPAVDVRAPAPESGFAADEPSRVRAPDLHGVSGLRLDGTRRKRRGVVRGR